MNPLLLLLSFTLLATAVFAGVLLYARRRRAAPPAGQPALSSTFTDEALRATLEHTPNVAVQWYDEEGRVRYWNQASCTVFGWSVEEALGRTLDELGLYDKGQAQAFLPVLQDVLAGGAPVGPAESSFSRKDGSRGIIQSTLFRVPGVHGAARSTYAACMDVDVTQRLNSDDRLRVTLENTPGVAVQWYDREARVLYWNTASEALYGIDTDDALGRRMDELLLNAAEYEDLIAALREVERAKVAGNSREVTLRGRHGLEMTVLRKICLIPGERGEAVFACMEVDITDARAAERDREQLTAVLERVTDALPVCLSYMDPAGRYVWTNARNSARLGLPPERMIGLTARDVYVATQRPVASWQNTVEMALEGGAQHGEREWLHEDGVKRIYETLAVPDVDAAGNTRGCTSVWIDVTARKEVEHRIQRLNRVHAVLSNINAALVRIKDARELFEEACRVAAQHGGFGVAWLGLIDRDSGVLRSAAWAGPDAGALQAHDRVSTVDVRQRPGLLGRCAREGVAQADNDISRQALPAASRREEAVALGYRSVIVLPLTVAGRVAGLFGLMSKEADFFNADEIRLLTELAQDVAFAMAVMEKEDRLNYLAYYSPLTGLPNRALLTERLTRLAHGAAQRAARLAVVVVDVRRFRLVNESLGRQAGDELLRLLGSRLREAWPQADNVGHLSGDHFALVLDTVDGDAALVHAVSGAVNGSVVRPFMVRGHEIRVTLSAGVAVFPDDGLDADTLLRNAEAAVKQATETAEPFLFYRPLMNARMSEAFLIESRMRHAFDTGQFTLHYQPKLLMQTGGVGGVEALMRWDDPDNGLVQPDRFIPVLEETGMIIEAGQWAMARVLKDREQWARAGLQPPRVAVNVSSMQLRRKDFTTLVKEMISGLDAGDHGLELEITESQLMEDIEGAIVKLKALRDMGVNVAIDDFGTGYSSLSYLARLPVNALKIDRTFVDGMLGSTEYMSIVSSVITLAHALKLRVIAEGVETVTQRGVLDALGCDEIQGFLVSQPMDSAAASTWLLARTPALAGKIH